MKKIKQFIILILIILNLACITKSYFDWEGVRFRCGYKNYTCISLSMLQEGCKLELIQGETIPPEASEKIILKRGEITREVRGPNDLAWWPNPCVIIKNENDAIEYLRFFSSWHTSYLFEEDKLEIYQMKGLKDCLGVCVPARIWNKLRLHEPYAKSFQDGFEVTRFVIIPYPDRWHPTIRKEKVLVKVNGDVKILEEEDITFCCEYTKTLFFPVFM